MANSAEYDVIINVITGHLEKATKQLRGMASATGDVSRANKDASKSGKEHNDIINGGVASANNGTRGFAKLRESINGSNGLVAAYATLATNAFAVGAAFNALQRAAQAEQIFKGIQEQGTRTGVTLTTVSRNMQEITNYSISASEAMAAAAQVSAAGFSTKSMEDLTQAAANSAAALGRSVPESLDRFIKGTTKLEPELLDEMGIMIKLEEATSNYAQSMGKLPTQLTATEKRTGYLNAVIAESDKKFRGMADAAGANPYDQLSSAFQDLTKNTLNWINTNGAEDFVKSLASNTQLLTATLVLFGSTIVKQIIPGLYGMAAAAAASAAALAKQAAAQAAAVLEAEEVAAASRTVAMEQARTLSVVEKNSAAYKAYARALKDGTATEAQKTTALRGLSTQMGKLEQANKRLTDLGVNTEAQLKEIEARKLLIATYQEQKTAIEKLADAEQKAQMGTEAAQAGIKAAQNKEKISQKASEAQSSFAQGLESAGSGDLLGAFASIKEGLGSLQESYRTASEANGGLVARVKSGFATVKGSIIGATTSLWGFITASNGMSRFDTIITGLSGLWFRLSATIAASGGIMNTVKLAFTGLAWSIKAIGTAVLSAIPIIGQLFFAFEMIMEYGPKVWEAIKNIFRSEEQKKAAENTIKLQEASKKADDEVTKSQEALKESQETSVKVLERYGKAISEFNTDAGEQKAAIIAVSNSMKELGDRALDYYNKQQEAAKAAENLKNGTVAIENMAKKSGLNIKAMGKDADEYVKVLAQQYVMGNDKIKKSIQDAFNNPNINAKDLLDLTQKISGAFQRTSDSVTGVGESFKSLDKEAQAFAQGLVQSTSYDGLIDKLQEANNSVVSLKTSFADTRNLEEFGNQLQSVVNTTAIKGLIDPAALEQLSKYTTKLEFINVLKERAAKGDRQAQVDADKYTKELESSAAALGETLALSLQTRQNELLVLQSTERTIQATIAIENSRYKAFQRFAGETAESARAADAHEEKLQNLEKSKLQLQLNQLDVQIQSVLAQKAELAMKRELYKQDQRNHEQSVNNSKAELQATIAAAKAAKPVQYNDSMKYSKSYNEWFDSQVRQFKAIQQAGEQAEAQLASLNAVAEDSKAIANLDTQIENFNRSIDTTTRSLTDAKKAITGAMAAISAGNMTDAEKAARDLGLNLKIVQDVIGTIAEHEAAINGIIDKRNSLSDKQYPAMVKTAALSKDMLARNISSLEVERASAKLAITSRIAYLKSAATNSDLSKEERDARAAELRLLETKLSIFDKITEARKSDLIVAAQVQLLEAASINTLKEGLEIQKKSLDIINAQFDAQERLTQSKAEGRKLDAQIAAKRFGKELDPELQKQLEITAAKESLKLAEEQLQAKIEGIKLEYALLEAQKISTMIELSMQKKILETKLRSTQNGGLTQDQQVMLDQITQSVNELGKYSYNSVRDIAIATAKTEVQNKRKTVELLTASSALGDNSDNLLNNVLFAIDTARRIQNERAIGDSVSTNAAGIFTTIKDSVIPDMSKVLEAGLQKVEDTSGAITDVFNKKIVDLSTSINGTDKQFNIITEDMKILHNVIKGISPEVRKYMQNAESNINSGGATADIGSPTAAGPLRRIEKVFQKPSDIKMRDTAWGDSVAKPLVDLVRFMQTKLPGAIATSFNAGKHNPGSSHSSGLKVDITGAIATADIQRVVDEYTKLTGNKFSVRDEHVRPKGQQEWGGPHTDIKFTGIQPIAGRAASNDNYAPTRQPFDEKLPARKESPLFNRTPGPFDFGTDISAVMDGFKSQLEIDMNSIMADLDAFLDRRIQVYKGTSVNTDKLVENVGHEKFGTNTNITDPASIDKAGFSAGGLEKLQSFKSDLTAQADSLKDTLYNSIFGDGKLQQMSAEQAQKAIESFQTQYAQKIGPIAQAAYAQAFPAGGIADKVNSFWADADVAAKPFLDSLKTMGPEGELVASIYSGVETMSKSVTQFAAVLETGKAGFSDYAAVAGSILSSVGNILESGSKAKIATIDKEIAAEQKRDGKSKESVAKIAQLQKKKEAEEKKAFERQKKMKIAEAIISTAVGIAKAIGEGNIPKAILVGALGAAQIAIIASTKYEGGNTSAPTAAMPSTLSIGKRSDTVDLAKGSNANAGGEVGYLRGASGQGSNASNYRTVGSAYGGELMRGYGNRGFVVGEKGPEVITPETPISVTPANDVGSAQPINANFTIQALDSNGVQDILVSQKGNIIKMLREAANASGKTFMEDVNVNVYTRPSVGKL